VAARLEFVAKALVDAAESSFCKWTEKGHLNHSRFVGLQDAGDPRKAVKEQSASLDPLKMSIASVNRLTTVTLSPSATTTTGGTMGHADASSLPVSSRLTICEVIGPPLDWHSDCNSKGCDPSREEQMIACFTHQCDYCRSSIVSGQRWVREKIYDPALNGRDPSYHRYHSEPSAIQEGSCWEKHQMEREIARTTARAA